MPDQKISVDPAAADLSGCIIPVVTGGINKQAANSLFGITGVANGVIYSAGNRNTSDPTNFNYVPGTQTLTVVGPIRTSPVTNEATVATPANGMIIYSTALSKFRAYENGAWVNLIGGAGGGWPFTGTGTFTGAVIIDQTTTAGNTLKFLTPNLGVTSIDGKGLWIQNPTVAAAGAQQYSGSIVWEGQGWATTPVASQSVKFRVDVQPVQGAANPTGIWRLQTSINGAAYTQIANFTSSGQLFVNSTATSSGGGNFLQVVGNIAINSVPGTAGMTMQVSGNDVYMDASLASGGINLRTNGFTIAASVTSTQNFNVGATTATNNARLYVLQPALSSSWLPTVRIDPGAHTSMTAATEFKDYNFNTRTATWLAGTTATQRFAHFQGQTVAGASASATFTDLYTVYIDPSIQGSQAIITNNWALGLGGGLKLFAGTTTRPALVIPTGTNLTTSQAGAMENDGTHLWFTFANSGARWQLDNQVGTFGWALAGNTLVADGIIGDIGTGGFKISLYTNNTARQVIDSKGNFTFTQDAQSTSNTFINATQGNHTGGTNRVLLISNGTRTSQTAPVGFNAYFAFGQNTQLATGNVTLLRSIQFESGGISFVGASTVTNAVNIYVYGALSAGTNATFTNAHSIYVESTSVGATTTNSYGLTVNAQFGATNNYAAQFLGGQVNFAAGTTTYAPIVIPSGTNMTTPVAGVVENNGTNLFFTPVSTRLAVSMNASAVTPATTGTMTTTLTNLSAITITPTGACTFNASGGISGQRCAFVITTSGVTSFVLTWGTNFKTTGTLATGTVTAKVFTVEFVYDSVNWNEVARTVAM